MAQRYSEWPYPFWIAHRGAGQLAPENTMAAFELGAQHGFRMFECDAKLSADGQLYLLHDATLDRTTNHTGSPADMPWNALAALDAGSWHSTPFESEPLLQLESLLHWCYAQDLLLNIELKPLPGQEAQTAVALDQLLTRMDSLRPANQPLPLVSSFSAAALHTLQVCGNSAPRALLLGHWCDTLWPLTQSLHCAALICHYQLWTHERVRQCHAQGMRALSYTVNDTRDAQTLIAMHTDGIITDAVNQLGPKILCRPT